MSLWSLLRLPTLLMTREIVRAVCLECRYPHHSGWSKYELKALVSMVPDIITGIRQRPWFLEQHCENTQSTQDLESVGNDKHSWNLTYNCIPSIQLYLVQIWPCAKENIIHSDTGILEILVQYRKFQNRDKRSFLEKLCGQARKGKWWGHLWRMKCLNIISQI